MTCASSQVILISLCLRSCGVDNFESGMSWFSAMECCYFNKGYLAEPTNEQEQNKIVEYITAGKSYLLLLDHDKMKLILSKICI